MKCAYVWAIAVIFAGASLGAAGATAPETSNPAANTARRSKAASPRASESRRAGAHRTAVHKAGERAKSSTAHAAARRTPARRTEAAHESRTRARTVHASARRTSRVETARTHATRTRASAAHGGAGEAARAAELRRPEHVRRVSVRYRRHHYYEQSRISSLARGNPYPGDVTGGEDPVVRQAAFDALDGRDGTIVVINPYNGRILAMVNQKLALAPGVEPCSTIKLTVAFAALSEGLITRDTMVQLPGFRMNLTQALAHSNNLFFEEMGRELGFARVHQFATEFGLGELAGYHIPGEQLGEYPEQPIPASEGGVGRMCSFGQGVSLTPLQLGAVVATIANGGTLYYLQHPDTPQQVAGFVPRVKRKLNIAQYIPSVEDGMAGAVEFGTARSLRVHFKEYPVFGKTGSCSNDGKHLGWFASFVNAPQGKLVAVFLLEGGRPTYGPYAAHLAGEFYKNLWEHNYFALSGQAPRVGEAPSPDAARGAQLITP
jgi:penicillin-binding protein 2